MNYYVYLYRYLLIPFYVGEGKGDRRFHHLWYAERTSSLAQDYPNPHLIYKIRKILQEGATPEIIIVAESLTQSKALALEKKLIKRIGRSWLNEGPLCNLAAGGIGGDSERTSQQLIAYFQSEEGKRQAEVDSKRKLAFYQTSEGRALAKATGEKLKAFLRTTEEGMLVRKVQSEKARKRWTNPEEREAQRARRQAFFQTEKGSQQAETTSQHLTTFYQTEEGLKRRKEHSKHLIEFYQTSEGKTVITAGSDRQKEFWETEKGKTTIEEINRKKLERKRTRKNRCGNCKWWNTKTSAKWTCREYGYTEFDSCRQFEI
ncbi:MAG: hypothetical protein WC895_04225 [Candidatus Shapirobacteria bacterium]|jgi:hypothetical protein